ncbi:hypothetical protein Ciccas_010606 [Cichlidogyrus casuarinus]|uniref:Uncharacterized protein n=1 Tax=Cichlidogyrus casuarinus TaxID=1844966 RepID=A0ABD2PTP2_9PLAT
MYHNNSVNSTFACLFTSYTLTPTYIYFNIFKEQIFTRIKGAFGAEKETDCAPVERNVALEQSIDQLLGKDIDSVAKTQDLFNFNQENLQTELRMTKHNLECMLAGEEASNLERDVCFHFCNLHTHTHQVMEVKQYLKKLKFIKNEIDALQHKSFSLQREAYQLNEMLQKI